MTDKLYTGRRLLESNNLVLSLGCHGYPSHLINQKKRQNAANIVMSGQFYTLVLIFIYQYYVSEVKDGFCP